MVLIAVVIVLAGLAVVAACAVLAFRLVRAERLAAAADRAETLRAAQEALAIERHQTVQSAVDTVLAVAGEKFADHSSAATRELDLRSTAISQQFETVSGELSRMRALVEQLQRERAEQHGRLERGLQEAVHVSSSLNQTTQALREALASSRARGQWGERLADDVLRAAGFVEGVNYRKQTGIASGGIPDFTFLLPHDRVLHMDVKFPLDNYLRHLEATSDTERAATQKAFLRDVRARIKEIADRSYQQSDDALDVVLLFIPNEAVYTFIHESDPGLLDKALAQRVVMCSPSTLFAVLAVVRQSTRNFLFERTSTEILECLTRFVKQWDKFAEQVDKVGRHLDTLSSSFDDLRGTRRRQLEKELDRIEVLQSHHDLAAASPTDDAGDWPPVRELRAG